MVTKEELKDIVLLSFLNEERLSKVVPLIERIRFESGELVFKQKELAENFFMLSRGKVLLEQHISDKVTVSVGSIKPGHALGWSAMIGHERYTSDAICAEPSELFKVSGDKINALMDEDPVMGRQISKQILHIVKYRIDQRTQQLVRVIQNHPDMKDLIHPKDE